MNIPSGSQVISILIRIYLTHLMLFPISIQAEVHLVSDVDLHFEVVIIAKFHFAIRCFAMPS